MYRNFVVLTAFLAFAVIVLGAYVRLSDAGLGCPDWPGCYGEATPGQAAKDIAAAEAMKPQGPVTLHKAWKEMTHRYFASTLGLFIVAIAIVAWLKRAELKQSPALPFALVSLVIFQGLLGMWTVTLLLKPAVVTAHLLGGMTTLALLNWLALGQFQGRGVTGIIAPLSTRWLAGIGVMVLAVQIALGGWVSSNYAGLACPDFPLCRGALLPQMGLANASHLVRELGMTAEGEFPSRETLTAIHWIHRVGALVTLLVLGLLAWRLATSPAYRTSGKWLALLLTLQLSLGVANVFLRLPLVLAVAHNAGAALLIVTMVTINFNLYRMDNEAKQSIPQRARSAVSR